MRIEFTEEQRAVLATQQAALQCAADDARASLAERAPDFQRQLREFFAAGAVAVAAATADLNARFDGLAQAARQMRIDVPKLSISANHATSSVDLPAVR